jgi:hypothetical protein
MKAFVNNKHNFPEIFILNFITFKFEIKSELIRERNYIGVILRFNIPLKSHVEPALLAGSVIARAVGI